jgi:hypothetical protein
MRRKSWKRLQQAANKHRRVRWRADREVASTPSYKVNEADGVCHIVLGEEVVAGPFSNAEAWRWIDRNTVARRYG